MKNHSLLGVRRCLLLGALSLLVLSASCIPTSKPEATPTPAPPPTLAPSPTAEGEEGEEGGTLRLLGEEIETWDPHRTEAAATHRPLSLLYSKLFSLPRREGQPLHNLTPLPDLVERWEMTSPTTYVFQLRRGVRFQDKPPVLGRELVAEDVYYSLARFRDSALPSRAWWRAVAGIEVSDRYTVKINLSEPFAPLLFYLGGHFSWILAREVEGETRASPEGAIGTGAWLLKDYVPGARAVFQRHPNYFLPGLPYVEEIQWQIVKDPLTRRAALRTGMLDLMPVDEGLLNELKQEDPELKVYEYMPISGVGALALSLRTDLPPFSDPRVRRAASLSIHRQSWRDTFLQGKGEANAAPVLAALGWGLSPQQLGTEGRYYRFDVGQARKLLAETGHPRGLATYLNFPQGQGYERQAEVLADFLAAVGIAAELRPLGERDYLKASRGDYEGMLLLNLPPLLEPDEWFYLQFHSAGGRNASRVRDASLDEMLKRQASLWDKTQRDEALGAIQRYAAEQVYYLYLPSAPQLEATSPRVKNYRPIPDYDLGSQFLEVWLEK